MVWSTKPKPPPVLLEPAWFDFDGAAPQSFLAGNYVVKFNAYSRIIAGVAFDIDCCLWICNIDGSARVNIGVVDNQPFTFTSVDTDCGYLLVTLATDQVSNAATCQGYEPVISGCGLNTCVDGVSALKTFPRFKLYVVGGGVSETQAEPQFPSMEIN